MATQTQKPLLLGTSDFDKIIEKDPLFIDKTMFIKEFIEDGADVSCILRPRRFGKSTNLSMLKSFLSLGAQSSSFSRYLISKETTFVAKHCGQYPVIYLNFKDCKGETWDQMYQNVWLCIRDMVERHYEELAHIFALQDPFELQLPKSTAPDDISFVSSTLKWLMKRLFRKHKKRVIVLVDEYDAPLNHAFKKGFYDVASNFFGGFYSSSLKQDGESSLEKACLMGIVEVRGAGILSGLNNIKVFCSADQRYSSSFGFLSEEIVKYVGSELNHVIDWYNGYIFGSATVINPWSFMNYLESHDLKSYWIGSSYMETLFVLLDPHAKDAIAAVINLICSGAVDVTPLTTRVNYSTSNWQICSILHFLVHTGYLTYRANPDTRVCQVSIPNKELEEHWKSEFIPLAKSYVRDVFDPKFSDRIRDCLTVFNSAELEALMREMILHPSFHDTCSKKNNSENSYHMFFYGCFLAVLSDSPSVVVSSNKEAGHGRFDIRIEFRTVQKAVVFEFKTSRIIEDLEKDAGCALEQCKEKQYTADLGNEYQCYLIGVSFFKKQMSNLCIQ